MEITNAISGFIFIVLLITSLLTITARKPSTCALFLFIESVFLSAILGFLKGITSIAFSTSIILSFFAMVVCGICLYFEASFAITPNKIPKLSVLTGLALSALFFSTLFSGIFQEIKTHYFMEIISEKSILSYAIFGFSSLCILVSALIIFDTKNSKEGGPL